MKNNSVNKRYVPKLRFREFDGEYSFEILNKYLEYEQPTKYLILNNKNINEIGNVPVLTANKSFILGYVENELNNCYKKGECFIFDDFTTDIKYVNFLFKLRSSAAKIITTKNDNYINYFFYLLKSKKPETSGHKRHWIEITSKEKRFIPPTLKEQEKISIFLSLLDKQISLLENKLKLTELKMKDFIKKSNIESSKLKIKDISIVIDGFPFKQTSYVKEGIPIYTISNIGDNKFIDTIEYKYTNIEIDSKYQLNKGDIFASLTGEKGFKSLLYKNENKNYINQRTIKIEIKNNYSPELLQFWCFKNKRKISLLATGSQKNISKKDVENFLVPKCTKENINLSKIFFNYIKNVQLIQDKLHVLNKRKTFFLKNLFI